jgi:Uri superfamily endonuclease
MQARPGTYALIFSSETDQLIRVGRLGPVHVPRGFLVYIGSALGPGGVRARVGHHLRISRRPRWHVDYLRARTRLDEVWYCYDTMRREHDWAEAMGCQRKTGSIRGFGVSDCRCESHLYSFAMPPSRRAFVRQLRALCPTHLPVYRSGL